MPFGVKVKNIEPTQLLIKLEESLKKNISVSLQTVGQVPIDHKMTDFSLFPKTILVSGPKSIVQNIQNINTSVVNLNDITGSVVKRLKLQNKDLRLEFSSIEVKAQFEIQTTRSNMEIKNLPIYFLTPGYIKKTSHKFANLKVLAENTEGFKLKTSKIRVIAEVINNGKYKQQVKLTAKLPKGLQLLEIKPISIEVEIEN